MVARMLGSSYPDRSFVHALGFGLPPAFEEVVRQRNHALTSAAAHLLPDEVVRAYAWVGTADQVAAQVAAVVDLGIRNITFLAHAPKNGSVDGTVQAFATEVKPRVEALLKG
jgi:alkanesulfonate monooxygenase SsuD/methylene tetrahydromethanopterin reductase-like flavin-dependent oxidoreductase (luciferase family)